MPNNAGRSQSNYLHQKTSGLSEVTGFYIPTRNYAGPFYGVAPRRGNVVYGFLKRIKLKPL